MKISRSRFVFRGHGACVLLLLLGTTLNVSSRADDLRGPYLGAALYRATLDFEGTLDAPSFSGRDSAFKLLGGYRLSKRLAVDGSYLEVDDVDRDSAEGDLAALPAAMTGFWPRGNLDLYGKAGLSYWRRAIRSGQAADSRDRFVDPLVGVGVQYRFRQLVLRADFDVFPLRLLNSLDDAPSDGGWVETWSIGTVWRFH